jgi:hypothetical protein
MNDAEVRELSLGDIPSGEVVEVSPTILARRLFTLRKVNEQVAAEYAEAMQRGDIFPPVDVWTDGKHMWVSSGGHRVSASLRANRNVRAIFHQGGERDAVLHAVATNADHGLRRSVRDKREAVAALLLDAEWRQWSDHEIARRCAVSPPFVGKMRTEFKAEEKLHARAQEAQRTFDSMRAAHRTLKGAIAETEAAARSTENVSSGQADDDVRRAKDGRTVHVRNIGKKRNKPTEEELDVARAMKQVEMEEKAKLANAETQKQLIDELNQLVNGTWGKAPKAGSAYSLLWALQPAQIARARAAIPAQVEKFLTDEQQFMEKRGVVDARVSAAIEQAFVAYQEAGLFLRELDAAWKAAHQEAAKLD